MTRKKATFLKIFQLALAHVVMIVVLMFGYDQAYNIFQSMVAYAGNSWQDMFSGAKNFYFHVMSLDKHVLFGSIFIAGLLAYDIVSIGKWLSSFSLTTTRRCNHCKRKLVREPRQPIDRFVSFIISLKRYRCIACNDEYLYIDNRSKREFAVKGKTLQPSPVKKSE